MIPEKCRTCLEINMESSVVLKKIFGKKSILETLSEWASIEILDQDPLPERICQCCFKKFESFYEFRQMIIESDTKLKDLLVLHSELDLGADIKTEPGLDASGETLSANFEYIEIKTLQEHIDEKESEFTPKEEEETKRTTKSKATGEHECQDCNKVFKTSYECRIHMKVHTGERNYACDLCPKKFAKKGNLVYHRRTHTGEKPYTCNVCSKSFCRSTSLLLHQNLHTGEKNYKCTTCNQSFNRPENLKIHARIHTGEKPYMCEICSSSFRSHNSLRIHKKNVHVKEACPICHKMYGFNAIKNHIQQHKEREQGIKRFVCDHCDKRFTCYSSRKEHLRIHTGEKPYSCEICGKAFTQRSTWKAHSAVHTDTMPFSCHYCVKRFKYKRQLPKHIAAHHMDLATERPENPQQLPPVISS